jgi:DNA-binding transcriptional LysR family regulator
LSIVFAPIKRKPRVVEEHDSHASVVCSLEAGSGVAIASDAFSYTFGHRIKLVRLTPEPKPIKIGIAARKGRLSPMAERFWQCAREAVASK